MNRPYTRYLRDTEGRALPLPSEHKGGYAYALEMTGVLRTPEGEVEVPKTLFWSKGKNDYRADEAEALLEAAPIGAVYEAFWTEEHSENGVIQPYLRRVYIRTNAGWKEVEELEEEK